MHSWVRYSVAAYVGLLLAGAIVVPRPQDSSGAWSMWEQSPRSGGAEMGANTPVSEVVTESFLVPKEIEQALRAKEAAMDLEENPHD